MPNTIKAETAHVLEKIAVHCKDEDDPAEAAFNLIQQAPSKVFNDLGVDKFDLNYRKTQSHTGKFYKSLLNMKNWTVDKVREHIQMLAAAAAAQSPDGAPDLPVPVDQAPVKNYVPMRIIAEVGTVRKIPTHNTKQVVKKTEYWTVEEEEEEEEENLIEVRVRVRARPAAAGNNNAQAPFRLADVPNDEPQAQAGAADSAHSDDDSIIDLTADDPNLEQENDTLKQENDTLKQENDTLKQEKERHSSQCAPLASNNIAKKDHQPSDDVPTENINNVSCWTCHNCQHVMAAKKRKCGKCHHWKGGKRTLCRKKKKKKKTDTNDDDYDDDTAAGGVGAVGGDVEGCPDQNCSRREQEEGRPDQKVESLRKEMETIVAEPHETNTRLQAETMQLTEERDNLKDLSNALRTEANAKIQKSTLNKKVLGVKPIVSTTATVKKEEKKKEEEEDDALQTFSKKYWTKLKQEFDALTEEHNAARSDNEELRKQCASESKAHDEEVKSLRKEMETIVAEKQKVNETNTRLKAEIVRLKEERDNLVSGFQLLKIEANEKIQVGNRRIGSLRKGKEIIVAEAEEACTSLQEKIMQLTEERDKLGEELRKWENRYNTLKTEANEEITKSKSDLLKLHIEHKTLQDKYINDMSKLASKKTVREMKETLEYMRAEMDDLDCNVQLLDRQVQECEENNEVFQENTNERFNGLETDVHNVSNGLEDVENANANLQDEVDEVKEQANTTSNDVYDLQMAQVQAASAEGMEEEEEDDDEDDDDGDSQTPQGVPASDEIVASLFTFGLDESGGDNSDSSQRQDSSQPESSHSQQDSSDDDQSADLLSSGTEEIPWFDELD